MAGTCSTVVLLLSALAHGAWAFNLHIVHLNDFHARYEQVSTSAGTCKDPSSCVGGLPRVVTLINEEIARDNDTVLLNAGDNFQGTLWYSLFRWNVTAHFMNELRWDALVIGNHEFDHGVAGVVPFLQHFKYPSVLANVDDSDEPTFQNLTQPSVIIERGGRKIGIIGFILKSTPTIASTGNLKFGDELEAVEREGKLLKEQGVDIILGLSHSGIEVDISVAEQSSYVDVIVGGHSHTLLYNGTPPSGSKYGSYPWVVSQDTGRTVLVVQASAYTKYLGNISVEFDDDGEVQSWTGNPIYLETSITQDEATLTDMEPWRVEVEALGVRTVGSTRVTLDKTEHDCYSAECSLGNFVTDAYVDAYVGKGPNGTWTAGAISLTNAGGLRTNIEVGNITYGDLVTAQPFENTVDLLELQGCHLSTLLEDAANTTMIQWSGLRVVYDYSQAAGSRVVSAEVRCYDCDVPTYGPIEDDVWYPIVVPSFVAEGGDDFQTLVQNFRNRTIGSVDVDLFLAYLERHDPLVTEEDGRLVILNSDVDSVKLTRRHEGLIFNGL